MRFSVVALPAALSGNQAKEPAKLAKLFFLGKRFFAAPERQFKSSTFGNLLEGDVARVIVRPLVLIGAWKDHPG